MALPPPTKEDLEYCKRIAKGGPRTFQFHKGVAEGFFSCLIGRQGSVGTIFGGVRTPSVCHAKNGTPRLTFRPVSIKLDTKDLLKIIYDIPVTSATKFKKHKINKNIAK